MTDLETPATAAELLRRERDALAAEIEQLRAEFDQFAITNTAAGIAITTGTPLHIVQKAVDAVVEQDRRGTVLAERDGVLYLTPNGVEMAHHALATWNPKHGYVVLWQLNAPGAGLAISKGYGDGAVMVQDNVEFDTLAEDAPLWLKREWTPELHEEVQNPPGGSDVTGLLAIATPIARYSAKRGVQLLVRREKLSPAAREYLDL